MITNTGSDTLSGVAITVIVLVIVILITIMILVLSLTILYFKEKAHPVHVYETITPQDHRQIMETKENVSYGQRMENASYEQTMEINENPSYGQSNACEDKL